MSKQKTRPSTAQPAEPSEQQMAVAIELMRLQGYRNVVDGALAQAKRILDRINTTKGGGR